MQTHYNDGDGQHHTFRDVKLMYEQYNCDVYDYVCKCIKKMFYQVELKLVCCQDLLRKF